MGSSCCEVTGFRLRFCWVFHFAISPRKMEKVGATGPACSPPKEELGNLAKRAHNSGAALPPVRAGWVIRDPRLFLETAGLTIKPVTCHSDIISGNVETIKRKLPVAHNTLRRPAHPRVIAAPTPNRKPLIATAGKAATAVK